MVRAAAEQAMKKAEQKNITLETSVSGVLPQVSCDQEKIGWVISQAVDNAIKFTPPGGSVQIESIQQNGVVTVSIRDTGIGMPDERLDEIFEPFHQLDGSSTRRYGGTGLGLALSKRILAAHNSPASVTSKVGEGTCFAFALPVSRNLRGNEER